jgi:hypothetical protein
MSVWLVLAIETVVLAGIAGAVVGFGAATTALCEFVQTRIAALRPDRRQLLSTP